MPYKPWSYAPVEYTRSQTAQRFRDRARALEDARASAAPTVAPTPPAAPQSQGGGGGGWLSKLGDLVPGPVKAAGGAALEGVNKVLGASKAAAAPVMNPYFGIMSGSLAAERKPIYDAQGQVVAYMRDTRNLAGLGGILPTLGGVAEGVAHPGRAGQAFEEAQRGTTNPAARFALAAVTDPLTYVGPGAVKGLLGAAPEAVQASRGARWAANVLESPRAVAARSVVGGAAGAQLGHELGGQTGETIGGLAGSVVGGAYQARSLSQIAEDVTNMADRFGIAPKGSVPGAAMVGVEHPHSEAYMDALTRHGIDFSIEGDGTLRITDLENAAAVADDLEAALVEGVMPGRRGGVSGSYDLSEGPTVDAWGEIRKQKIPKGTPTRGAFAGRSERLSADVNDAERIREVMDESFVPSSEAEGARSVPWGERRPTGYTRLTDSDRAAAVADYAKSARSRAGQAAARRLGVDDANEVILSTFQPDWTPRDTSRALQAEWEFRRQELVNEFGSNRIPARGQTMLDHLKKTAIDIEQYGHGVVEPPGGLARTGAGPAAPLKGARTEQAAPPPGTEIPPAGQEPPRAGAGPRAARPPLTSDDPWEILGLDPTRARSAEEVRAAYRARMRDYHPDVNMSATATADAQKINAAFERMSGGAGVRGAWGAGAGAAPPPSAGGAPPTPPAATPPPPASAPVPPAPKPREDMFRTTGRAETIQHAADYLGSVKGKIDQALRKGVAAMGGTKLDPNLVKDTEVTPFVVRWRNRIQNLTNSYEGLADEMWQRVEKSGIKVDMAADGEFRLANGAAFGDMVELSTPEGRAAYASLSHEQQGAVDALSEFNDALNANLRYHWGKDLPWDEEVAKAYFPRMVVGKGGIEKAYVGDRRGLGSAGSFMKERIHATLDEGLANKIEYAHPQQAYRAMVRAKLRVAGDAYVTDSLKPLGKKAKQVKAAGGYTGFNYVALPPDVAPSLNGMYFPRETAERIMAGLNGKPAVSIPGARAINTVLTPLRAMGDISWYGQQGSAMLFRHPLRAQQGALAVIKSSLGDVAQYTNLIDKEVARGPGLQELISRGMHWVPGDVGEIDIGFRVGGLPAYKQVKNFSNETFGRYLNYERLVFANDAWERATKAGLTGADFDREIQGALDSVNRMSGFTGRKPTSIESIGEFAPRFFSAAVEQTAAALTKFDLEGSIARRHIGRMLGFGALMVAGANAVRGYETDFDPRSNNFVRLRNIGGLDVSPFGTYDTLFRAIAATAAGQSGQPLHPDVKAIWHLAESKMSPALKLVYEPFIKQSTYDGEPLDPLGSWEGAAKAIYEQAKSSQPFGVQNIITEGVEPAIEKRSIAPLVAALPGEAASAGGFSNRPVTPAEKRDFARDDVAKEMFGTGYGELQGAQKAQVNADQRVAGHQAEADKNTLTRAGDRSRALQATQGTAAKVNALSEELEGGQISGNQFRDQYRILMAELRGSRDVLSAGGGNSDLNGWFALYDKAQKPDGSIDYDQLDALQAAYEAQHPDVTEKLDKAIGTHDNPVVAQYREAQKLAKEYYDLPAYRGMTGEESRKASQALMAASDMVAFGQARNMRQALGVIAQDDPEARQLARRAQSVGANRARKGFRLAHPEFAKFYSDI